MKKIVSIIFIVIFSFCFIDVYAIELDTYSNNIILYNLNDDSILYEKNKDEKTSIASLTKIMTSIVAIENIENLDEKVTLLNSDFYGLVEQNAATAGFRIGEEVTYRDLLYGLLLPSGADAAQALERLVAGSNEEFIKLMNEKAKELGMNNTNFANPTGLDDPNNYSTVNDVSKIFKYAIKNEIFMEIIRTKTYTSSNNLHTFKSTLSRIVDAPYIIGGKTGTTDNAGLCLATIAEKDNVKYMLITTKAPYSKTVLGNFLDAKTIYEYFMSNYSYKNVVNKKDILVKLKTKYLVDDYIEFKSNKNIDMYLDNNFKKEDLIYKYKGKKIITKDMRKKDKLGIVEIYYNDTLLTSIDIILNKKIEFDYIKYIKDKPYIVITPTTLLLLLFIIIIFKRKKSLH